MEKKIFLKKITVFLCVLCVMAGMFGGAGKYYASDIYSGVMYDVPYDESIAFPSFLPNTDGKNWVLFYNTHNNSYMFDIVDGSNYELECRYDTSAAAPGTMFNFTYVDSSCARYSMSSGGSWSKYNEKPLLWMWYADASGVYYLDYVVLASTVSISYDGTVFMNATHTLDGEKIAESVYNSSLGYLQNVTAKKLYIEDDDSNRQTLFKFSFDTTTTSGIDLTSGDYSVRLYEQTAIYKGGIWQPFDTPKVEIDIYDAGTGFIEFNMSDAMSKTDTITGEIEGYDFLSIALNNYVRADTYWLQIVNNDTGEYGGFVQMKQNPDLPGQFSTSTIHGSEDDAGGTNGTDNDGYVDNKVNSSVGSGTNYEDAELNADKNSSNAVTDFMDEIDNMVSMVSAVPQLFGALFSFLPDWCLDFVGAGVGFGVLLVIWKIARG